MHTKITENLVIEYRNRKSLEIQIKPDGKVRVLAPRHVSQEWILSAIKAKEKWILQKLNLVSQKVDTQPGIVEGATVLDQGDRVNLRIGIEPGLYPVERKGQELHINVIKEWREDEKKLKALLLDWYSKNTKERIEYYIKKWSALLKVSPKLVKIKDQKRRRGSCSSRGNLNFNWRLSMAPDPVVEYVVVHELCHFHHMNHSKDFWALVETCLPDYKKKKEWLKNNGQAMFWLE